MGNDDFLVTGPHRIYLDNAATTQVDPSVVRAMRPYFENMYANPESIHSMGLDAANAVNEARGIIAASIGAESDTILFTSGGSEANTMAIVGVANYLKQIGKTHIVTDTAEHNSVLSAMRFLESEGFDVTYILPDSNGVVNLCDVDKAVRGHTGLVSVMVVNNELGSMNQYIAIGQYCKNKGILFHTDAVQAYGHMEILVDECCADFISASAHKIHGPKGVGFLYVRDKDLLNPVIFGGEQEYGLRGGTHNVPGIVGFGRAVQLSGERRLEDNMMYIEFWKLFVDTLKSTLGDTVSLNGSPRLTSNIINLRFDGVDSETLLLALASKGVMVSAGSACDSHSAIPSHVLMSIGMSEEDAKSSVRISFSHFNTTQEVSLAANIIIDTVLELRK